jgi:hypothetical protein
MTRPIHTAICCPRCHQQLAESDGARLLLGAAFCTRIVTLQCAHTGCGGRVVWQPRQAQTTQDRTGVLAPA